MNFYLRFIVLMLLWAVFPNRSEGNDFRQNTKQDRIVLSDSLVKAQLIIADSLIKVQTQAADEILDTLLNFLFNNSIKDINLEYNVISRKWNLLKRLSRYEEAIKFLNKAISKDYSRPELYIALANAYQFNNEYSKSIASSQEAILHYQNSGNFQGVADAINNLIETYGKIGMFIEAEKYFNDNLDLCNKINYDGGLMRTYIEYGESLVFEDSDLSYELIQFGIKLAKTNSNELACSTSLVLMRYYINTNKFLLAKAYLKEYFNNCGYINKLQDSNMYTLMAHIYSLENNTDSTIYYNTKALESRILSGNKTMIANSYLNLSGNYLIKKEIEKANKNLEKAETYVLEGNNSGMLLTYYRGKVKYFEFIKDYNNAYLFSQKEIELSKEVSNQRYQSMLSKLNTSFGIQQKNILLEKELELRKSRIRMLFFVLLSILFLLGFVYLIYILRKKNYYYLSLVRKASNIEQKLSISNKERLKLQSIFNNSVTGILILDKNGYIQYGNPKSIDLLGKKENANSLQIPFIGFFENANKTIVQNALINVFNEHQIDIGFKAQIINLQNFRWLDISFTPLAFEQEKNNILVTLIDVTQEVINIGREKEQKKELQTLLNSVTESILFIQRNGIIKAFNNTSASRLNAKQDELDGANYFDIIPTALKKRRIKMFNKVIRSKKPLIDIEIEGNYNNLVSMYPNINAEGTVDYISEFVQDITERRLAEQQIDQLKQRVFRSQMDPHFIFNSLTSIQSFVIRNDATMASKYLNSFARLIRLILESSRHDYISLRNEIDILNYYLDLQKMRFSDNFKYSFKIDPSLDTEKIKIPPMLAQPFIENAIEHGIQHLYNIGEIKIEFVKEGSHLLFEIHDNGIGRDASKILNKANILASESLSTLIINDRLMALNKYAREEISFNIIDLKDEQNQATGTKVTIRIPIDNF